MLDINRILRSNRQMKALTGMNIIEFELLVPRIDDSISLKILSKKVRKRKAGGGRKGVLNSMELKLFFILFYLKVYPTYDLASAIFGVDKSRVCRWVKELLPILESTLKRSYVLPKRKIQSLKDLFDSFPETKDLFIDGTERRINRPKQSKNQRNSYSGKQKSHTRKNIVICDKDRRIMYVSPTKNGKVHDFTQARKELLFDNVPDKVCLWVDKGFQGIKNIVPPEQVEIPHKKPKGKSLSTEQKQENNVISSFRIVIEHAIGGIKRFGCMAQKYRNHRGKDDQMIKLCAGLWNFHIQNS